MTKADRELSASRKVAAFPRQRATVSVDVCGPVFIMHWHLTPCLEDVRRVLDDAREARLSYGKPMLQLVVVANDAFAMPPADVRSEMSTHMKEMDENFDGHVLILAALGFVAAAIHALASTLSLAGSRRPGRTRICRTFEDGVRACTELAPPKTIDEATLRKALAHLATLGPP